ncbi:MAG: winged helix-turn-helix transcriptional regulator, partial [Pseudomonadota bacterium]
LALQHLDLAQLHDDLFWLVSLPSHLWSSSKRDKSIPVGGPLQWGHSKREQIRDRTRAGMQAAKDRGVHVGRPQLIQPEEAELYAREIGQGRITVAELAERIGVAPQTVARAVRRNTRG